MEMTGDKIIIEFDDEHSKEETIEEVLGLVKKVQIDIMDGNYTTTKTWPFNGNQFEEIRQIVSGEENFPYIDDFILETVLLPQNMTINSLTADPLSIVFQPPKPTIYLNGLQEINDASVILFSSSISNKQGVAGLNRFTGRVTSAIQDR